MRNDDQNTTPLLPRDQVLVALNEDWQEDLDCALQYGLGAEIQTFSFPEALVGDYSENLETIAKAVASLQGPIGIHGPFIDLPHASSETLIVDVCRFRYLESLDIAQALGASFINLHSQYNAMLKLKEYPEIYHEQSLRFWPDILAEAEKRNIVIYLENFADPNPYPLARLAAALDSPYLKLCLDVAHSSLYGNDVPFDEWADAFAPHLRHAHLNDTSGTYDDHMGLGEGALDIESMLKKLQAANANLTYLLETNNAHTCASVKFLGITESE